MAGTAGRLPRLLLIWWWVCFPLGLAAVVTLVWERTYFTWEMGPGRWGAHLSFWRLGGLLWLGLLLLGVWCLAAGLVCLVRTARGPRDWRIWRLPLFTALVLYLPMSPYGAWEVPMLALYGPGAKPNLQIQQAARFCSRRMVTAYLDAGADVNFGPEYDAPLILAAQSCDAAFLAWLVDSGADIARNGHFALQSAIRSNTGEAVELLLARGADPRRVDPILGQSALDAAIARGDEDILAIVRRAVGPGRD